MTAGRHAAQVDHLKRVTVARAKLEAANARMARNHVRGLNRALQRAGTRFLPPGAEPAAPRVLDLARWPYAGSGKLAYDVPQGLRNTILAEDVDCMWCRAAPSTTIDHVHPLSRGGSNHPLNLVGACEPCNSAKSVFLPSELGWVLRLPPRAFELGQGS